MGLSGNRVFPKLTAYSNCSLKTLPQLGCNHVQTHPKLDMCWSDIPLYPHENLIKNEIPLSSWSQIPQYALVN